MKCKLSLGEKLKDLRVERGLTLEELSTETKISKSALGSYESDETKNDININPIITLAKYYDVSTDYLLGLTDNRKQHLYPVDELGFDDETIDLLQNKTYNNRLISELIKHPEFKNFIADLEIYVDNIASMQIRNMNKYIAHVRTQICEKQEIPDTDFYMKTLKAATINEDEYFANLICNDIGTIAKSIKESHKNDYDTGDDTTIADELIDAFEEYQTSDKNIPAQLALYGKTFRMNFNKMSQYELKVFTDLLKRYSDVFNPVKGNGRGKKKK